MTIYGEEPEITETALRTFRETVDVDYEMILHCTKIGPQTREIVEFHGFPTIEREECSLPQAFNESAAYLLGKPYVRYLCSIHNDMIFDFRWLKNLVGRLERDITIGKISPINLRDGEGQEEREGNECPWVMRAEMWDKIGGCDPRYLGGGSTEDWRQNRRIKELGLSVLITPDARIFHHGMKTRFRYGTTNPEVDRHNAQLYFEEFKTNSPSV